MRGPHVDGCRPLTTRANLLFQKQLQCNVSNLKWVKSYDCSFEHNCERCHCFKRLDEEKTYSVSLGSMKIRFAFGGMKGEVDLCQRQINPALHLLGHSNLKALSTALREGGGAAGGEVRKGEKKKKRKKEKERKIKGQREKKDAFILAFLPFISYLEEEGGSEKGVGDRIRRSG